MLTEKEKLLNLVKRISDVELSLMANKYYLETLERRLASYQKAINKIDDYFEYVNESLSDRDRVHAILDSLANELSATCVTKN